MPSETELAWAAGFFDGEGCTTLAKKNANKTVRVIVAQKDIRPLQRFVAAVGDRGKIYPPRGEHMVRHWASNAEPVAREVLALLWPYLSEPKREQAERCFSQSTWHDGHRNQLRCSDPTHEIVERKSGGRRCKTCQHIYNTSPERNARRRAEYGSQNPRGAYAAP